jgi:prepilin-type N-terminal cleavage/methylation domain-containing protein
VSAARHARRARGFTLTELAVVFAIIGLLLASALYTLAAQSEQRNFEETRRRLEAARELLLAFAILNGRLPCPAISTSGGEEAPVGGGTCSAPGPYGGWLPARSIGYQVVDTAGFAIDAWGNRIRYAVPSPSVPLTGCTGSSTQPHFTNATTLRANGISCRPNGLVVCRTASGIAAHTPPAVPSCGAAAQVTNQDTLVAIVFSTGKNGAQGSAGIDEAANLNSDGVFVWHTPAPAGAANGEFDDQMQWISVGELYGKLIAAGMLP